MDSSTRASSRPTIAMATFNGERFLSEQIRSIQAQTVKDWTLLVRDDGSTDMTQVLLRGFAATDDRIEIVSEPAGNLGAVGNFAVLAGLARDRGVERLFFSDQDDVWFPDKVAHTLDALDDAEHQRGRDTPVLVYSDLQLIDSEGRVTQPSFMRFQRIRHEERAPLATLLVQNFVTGCAMAVNGALLRLAVPMPRTVLMHDWWFAQFAAAAGTLAFISTPTVSYRRHESNTVTVRGFWNTLNPLNANWLEVWRSGARHHVKAVGQAAALLERLRERRAGSEEACRTLEAFVALHRGRSALARLRDARRLGLRSQTIPRTIALYLRVLGSAD